MTVQSSGMSSPENPVAVAYVRGGPLAAIGKAVIIHLHPDDFRSQPAGAAGPRAACGVVEPWPGG